MTNNIHFIKFKNTYFEIPIIFPRIDILFVYAYSKALSYSKNFHINNTIRSH